MNKCTVYFEFWQVILPACFVDLHAQLQVTLFHGFTVLFFIYKSAFSFTIEPIFTPLLGLLLHTTLLIQGCHCTQSELNQLAFELWCQMPHALLHQHYHTVFSFNSTPTTSQTKHTQNISRSTLPSSSQAMTTTFMPASTAEAALVPWAEEGIRQISRCESPRDRW
jgi:hypothetical protein